jgi:hypothetical protein
MKRSALTVLTIAFFAAGCGSSTSPTSTNTPAKPTFTAALSTANEVPPITNAEAGGSGTATITFDITRDANNNITAATANFTVNLTGFPANTPINIAHIHQGAAGTNGSVVVNTTLAAGQVVLANGSGSFTRSGLAVTPVDLMNQILTNPAGFYFNAHTTLNPGGVVRGQLVRVQ